MRRLKQPEVLELHQAVLASGVGRESLLGGMSIMFRSRLTEHGTKSEQLLADLYLLAETPPLTDGTDPLLTWLHNARILSAPRPESGVFEDYVTRLTRSSRTLIRGASDPLPEELFAAGGEEPVQVDPLVAALTPESVQEHVREFRHLLDAVAPEGEIHRFLCEHSYFFNNHLRLLSICPLYTRIPVGDDVADFAWVDLGSFGPEWTFCEVGAPDAPLTRRSGEPSAALNAAVQRVRDFEHWIAEDLPRARQTFPHVQHPMSYLFIGRRSEITHSTSRRLRRLSYDHRAHLRIYTLDRFVDNAVSVLGLMGRSGRGEWAVPMRALSAVDFMHRRPDRLWNYLDDPEHAQTLRYHDGIRMNNRLAPPYLEVAYVAEDD